VEILVIGGILTKLKKIDRILKKTANRMRLEPDDKQNETNQRPEELRDHKIGQQVRLP
jgi:Holliday junction resolvasome RuvABC DNA-binding subunit